MTIKFNNNTKSIEYNDNITELESYQLLDSTKKQIEKKTFLQPIFVPEEILKELLLKNLPIDTILSLDKLTFNNIGYNQLNKLVLLNSLGINDFTSNINKEQRDNLLANIKGYTSYFNHLLDEVADIRSIWLKNCSSINAFKYIISFIEQTDNVTIGETPVLTVEKYLYDAGVALEELLSGICLDIQDDNTLYNNIIPTSNGNYYIIPVRLIDNSVYKDNGSEFDSNILINYVNNIFKVILRKAAIYYKDNEIAKSDFFCQYLLTL